MAQPTPYNRQFSFTNDQTANPTTKTPGNQLDAEFNAILTTFAQTLANLALIQRDDGQIANTSIGLAQFKAEVSTGVAPATAWVSAHSYAINDTVFFGLLLYRCITAHISGVFATDLAAGDWVQIADFTSAVGSPGVNTLGGQQGTITIPGGALAGAVLTVPRYDAAQSLTSGQQLQALSNIGAVCFSAVQSLNTTQQAQGRVNLAIHQTEALPASANFNNISTPGTYYTIDTSGTNTPSSLNGGDNAFYLFVLANASAGYVAQIAIGVNTGTVFARAEIGSSWSSWGVVLSSNQGLRYDTSQTLNASQALQGRSNLLMSTDIGKIEMWPTSDVPAGRLKCNGASLSRTTYADLFNAIVKSGAATFTNSSTSVGMTAHGRSVGDNIKLFTTGTLPTNFSAGTHGLQTAGTSYYIASVIDANTVTLSATAGGSAITAGSAGSGTHTWVSAPYGDGDGSTTFTPPDYRGYFLRGWDNAAGVDTNRSTGTSQADAMQGHFHTLTPLAKGDSSAGGAGSSISGTSAVSSTAGPLTDGTNGTPRTAAETRPKNWPVNYTIRYAA
jgi:hypothetical protein